MLFRFLWVHALSTWEQMFSVHARVLPLFVLVPDQLLIILMATMTAMTTIRITRTIRR